MFFENEKDYNEAVEKYGLDLEDKVAKLPLYLCFIQTLSLYLQLSK